MKYLFLPLLLAFGYLSVSAHSGRTDSSGGHNCNVGSCAGTYHYHNSGYTPTYSPINTYAPSYNYSSPIYSYDTTSCSSYGIMAIKDSLTDKCKCMSGYVFGKSILGETQCISQDQSCKDDHGYGSEYSYLKDNCVCKSGYTVKNNKCVYEIIRPYTDTQSYTIPSYNTEPVKVELPDVTKNTNVSCPAFASPVNGVCQCLANYEYKINECVKVEQNIKKEEAKIMPVNSFNQKEFLLKGGERLRDCGGKKCKVMLKSSKGDSAKILFKEGDWYGVQINANNILKTGYIFKDLIPNDLR